MLHTSATDRRPGCTGRQRCGRQQTAVPSVAGASAAPKPWQETAHRMANRTRAAEEFRPDLGENQPDRE